MRKHAQATSDGLEPPVPKTDLRELVVFSLEPWNEVWRRNQHFVDILLRRNPALRVLFVEPPTDPVHSLRLRRVPEMPSIRHVSPDGRLRALRPLKLLPRRLGSLSDRFQLGQVSAAMRAMRFSRPILWLNDPTYAPLIGRTGYPSLYDMTDDWLLAPFSQREIARIRALEDAIFDRADEVVVCSPGLLASRGGRRHVELIPNGVDVVHFARPQPRPGDLPHSPVAVYVGSLHESRLDVELVLDLARSLPELSVALVGPDSLDQTARSQLRSGKRIALVGARPYQDVPAYLQHADVVIVPHIVSPFTESLDPVKAYECLAVGRPTVATPVAGFRELRDRMTVEPRERFVAAVEAALQGGPAQTDARPIPSWDDRVEAFEKVLGRISNLNEVRGKDQSRTRGASPARGTSGS
jgi:glycosyltransferase involved in cell wall biosynthesis